MRNLSLLRVSAFRKNGSHWFVRQCLIQGDIFEGSTVRLIEIKEAIAGDTRYSPPMEEIEDTLFYIETEFNNGIVIHEL